MVRRTAAENRRHILAVADELFYQRGVRAVGMDLIIRESGVANATLYRQFATKDELVTAYLVDRNAGWWARAHAVTEAVDDPGAKVLALVRLTADDIAHPSYRGCATLNIASEFPDINHPAHAAAVTHKTGVRDWLREHAAAAGATAPDVLADQLMLIMDGAQALGATLGAEGPSRRLAATAEQLLSAARPAHAESSGH